VVWPFWPPLPTPMFKTLFSPVARTLFRQRKCYHRKVVSPTRTTSTWMYKWCLNTVWHVFCGLSVPKCGEGHAWTQFFDRDNPGGYGDYETLSLLLNENPGKLCKNPTAIDARLVSNNDPYQSANQVVTISTSYGFQCVNSQNSGQCEDYEVRFCCPSGDCT